MWELTGMGFKGWGGVRGEGVWWGGAGHREVVGGTVWGVELLGLWDVLRVQGVDQRAWEAVRGGAEIRAAHTGSGEGGRGMQWVQKATTHRCRGCSGWVQGCGPESGRQGTPAYPVRGQEHRTVQVSELFALELFAAKHPFPIVLSAGEHCGEGAKLRAGAG